MANCNFLKQKKQVLINGEWVDTRSFRYIPFCDGGGTPSVTIRGGWKYDVVSIQTRKYNSLIPMEGNGVEYKSYRIDLDRYGNGSVNLESDDCIMKISADMKGRYCVAEIKSCYVSDFVGENIDEFIYYCSTFTRKPEYDDFAVLGPGEEKFNGKKITFKGFDIAQESDMSFRRLFNAFTGLTSLDLSSFETKNVTNMEYMFSRCHNLESLDLSMFDVSNVKSIFEMFWKCSSLTTLDLSNWNLLNDEAPKPTYEGYTFHGCSKLKTVYMRNCPQTTIDNIKERLRGADILDQVTIIT